MATEFRHEYKYLCDPHMLAVERARLFSLLKPDPHTGKDGKYLIRSVYFDDMWNSSFYENENGEDMRAKYRLRIYNCSDDYICLERKAKLRGMTHKDAARVDRGTADKLISGVIPAPLQEHSPMLRRMLADMKLRLLRPAVIVQYVRTPFILEAGNVRVTLDEQISSSQSVKRFFDPDIPQRQVLPDGNGILEVKWDNFLPDWLGRSLELEGLHWTTFSKYYYCRIFNTNGEKI